MTVPSSTGTAPEPSETDPLGVEPEPADETEAARDEQDRRDGQMRRDDSQPPIVGDGGPES
ncbi:hypothetical protein Lfu02_68140 [Longispora fulva]|uniref:Uncharacterized protein n=1 Tax=Longispora fulva TaxID=619741 RepID=A0A8J7GM24_9ACTN|nr:hypothetical protein [Longispora fulva]MBG6134068.1 hypothetical protein [Longispora fulva]GIG62442.1 hypothetical protein Lfu02_68140 [Longispora fulva]